MSIFIILLLYIGLMTFVYNTLVLFRLIKENQVLARWYKYPLLLLKALCFIQLTKKLKACVVRWWASTALLALAAVLAVSNAVFT